MIEKIYNLLDESSRQDVFAYAFQRLFPGYKIIQENEENAIIAAPMKKGHRIKVIINGVEYKSLSNAARMNKITMQKVQYWSKKKGITSKEALIELIREKKIEVDKLPPVTLTVGGESLRSH